MKHVLLIAVGGIGFRHFQALLNCRSSFELYVADVSSPALEKARAYADTAANGRAVHYVASADELAPMHFDLAIIATSSLPRRAVFEGLVARHRVDNVIFEKVLFPRVEDYAAVGVLLQEKHIHGYVDCVRRAWPVYVQLRKELATDSHVHARISGGDWGLGCNAIHMVDVVDYLFATDARQVCCSGELLEDTLFESKRGGYVEFFGTLWGRIGQRVTYEISCTHDSAPSMVELVTPQAIYRIDEGAGTLVKIPLCGDAAETSSFVVPFVSQSTTGIADAILNGKEILLADYETSARLHLPVLQAFLRKQNEIIGKEETLCPIT